MCRLDLSLWSVQGCLYYDDSNCKHCSFLLSQDMHDNVYVYTVQITRNLYSSGKCERFYLRSQCVKLEREILMAGTGAASPQYVDIVQQLICIVHKVQVSRCNNTGEWSWILSVVYVCMDIQALLVA